MLLFQPVHLCPVILTYPFVECQCEIYTPHRSCYPHSFLSPNLKGDVFLIWLFLRDISFLSPTFSFPSLVGFILFLALEDPPLAPAWLSLSDFSISWFPFVS